MSFKFSSLFLPIKDFAIKLKKKDIKDVVTKGTADSYSLKYIEKMQFSDIISLYQLYF